jgi:cysteinyl-tRNA synthetase
MRPIKIFNNLLRQKVELKPVDPGKIRYYSCGPTTYDFLHLGNARALVVGDIIHLIFKVLGYDVRFVRNFTDIDDKIIQRANERGEDPLALSARFIKECQTDMAALRMLDPAVTPKVSETIPEIIKLIERLIENHHAYVVNGEVFYDITTFGDYGKLSKKDIRGLAAGVRIEVDDAKKHPGDFTLWKPAKPGEPAWDSPWGPGRPGWHIECSAMALKFLGEEIDLHHGGIDLMFPHHENEIAQSEGATGKTFARCWCHNEFLHFKNGKMSKSKGNMITIRDFCQKYDGLLLRYIFASHHYRAVMEWNEQLILKACDELERIHRFVLNGQEAQKQAVEGRADDFDPSAIIDKMAEDLANDFNTPGALGIFFGWLKDFQGKYLRPGQAVSKKVLAGARTILKFVQDFAGIIDEHPLEVLAKIDQWRATVQGKASAPSVDAAKIEALIQERQQAKANKDYAKADQIRQQLEAMQIEVKDLPGGKYSWKVKV